VKAAYEFVAGNSAVTPLGLALGVAVTLALLHANLAPYAGAAFIVALIATLAGSVFEKPN
jgi:hypothetical protein